MDYPHNEIELAKKRGYRSEQAWAKYRLSVKQQLKEKGINYGANEPTRELERKLEEKNKFKIYGRIKRREGTEGIDMGIEANDLFRSMSSYWYEQWYLKDVSPHLSYDDKMRLMHRISELSMREPIFEGHLYYQKKDFPELAPYVSPGAGGTHAYTGKQGDISGMQLYSVFMMLAKDMGMSTSRASMITTRGGRERPILPDLPHDTKRLRERADLSPAERLDELSDIGTDLVPDVSNKAGCDLIKGKWLQEKKICLLKDTPMEGWTAPIKGAYVYWSRETPRQKIKSPYPENERFYPDVPGHADEIYACHVYADDFYPQGRGSCSSTVYHHFPNHHTNIHTNRQPIRDIALELAGDIAKCNAEKHGLKYLDKTGKRVNCRSRDAIVAPPEKQSFLTLYHELRFSKSHPPFRIKAGV